MPILRGMRSNAKYVWIVVFIVFVGGFLLLDTSGLLGTNTLSPNTAVATVNGHNILYTDWSNRSQSVIQGQSERLGRSLNRDETKSIEDQVLEEMILEILMADEYKRRGITVTENEILEAAQAMPHPELMRSPDLQTDGRFDIEKYQRLLRSPSSQDLRLFLENYYRTEIPRLKLFQQVAADVYVSDAEMWAKWQEVHDSVQISWISLGPEALKDTTGITVSDAEVREHYDANPRQYEEAGRAVVTYVHIPKVVTSADTAAALATANELRRRIEGGEKFEDVAARESQDTATAASGGSLGRGVRGRFPEDFEKAAYALRPGQVSEPVKSQFGFHLLKVDERKGDTLALRHILIEIQQSDSAARAMDRRADSLAKIASGSLKPADFDTAVTRLGLSPRQAVVRERQPLVDRGGAYVPSVSAWAFSGVVEGETSDLFDADDGYYMARLDSLQEGGQRSLDAAREDIRKSLMERRKLEKVAVQAGAIASKAAATTLEQAAAEAGVMLQKSPIFTRISFVPGLGRSNEVIGAAFSVPTGAISSPVVTDQAVFVFRVDKRVNADLDAWEKQRDIQRTILTQSLQQERVQLFLTGLREQAKVEDNRNEINRIARG